VSIVVENLSHTYDPDSPWQVEALHGISLEIPDGRITAVIGPTGSGKSTLVQHFNGLLFPTSGSVTVDGIRVTKRDKNSLRGLRQRVGLVFQYPEHQLFEETVYADIAFGPRNLGLSGDEVSRRVTAALEAVGLDEGILKRSPFELSGGQTRRVAIAGVLAMQPSKVIFDEPAAGLDPRGRHELLTQIDRMSQAGYSIILVSHSMEDVARLASWVVVLNAGRLAACGTTREVFAREEELRALGLDLPVAARVIHGLRARGISIEEEPLTVEEAAAVLLKRAGRE